MFLFVVWHEHDGVRDSRLRHAFNNGIVTFGLMASSSGLVIPLTIFLIGTRVWALGKVRFHDAGADVSRPLGVQPHRHSHFVVQAVLLVPYIIIGIMGGGTTLYTISDGVVPFWFGGADRGDGGDELRVLRRHARHGLGQYFSDGVVPLLWRDCADRDRRRDGRLSQRGAGDTSPMVWLLTRERISPYYFFSYTFIPLSAIAFPHILIFCLTARKMAQFKKTVIFYPICILAIWLPCVFLGVMANRVTDVPEIRAKQEARRVLATQGRTWSPNSVTSCANSLRATTSSCCCCTVTLWLAGLLGAGIMAAVMASDSQILALSTMFTEDVFAFYGGKSRSAKQCRFRPDVFIILITLFAYVVALRRRRRSLNSRSSMRFQVSLRCRRCWWLRCSGAEARSGARWQ